mmetsp:Transcript_5771/g.17384  ORF Transcript_5771/g.17384 Transcript_5771/m.17384 type:complete len:270 (+) Transcript_5771:3211-4020(+)
MLAVCNLSLLLVDVPQRVHHVLVLPDFGLRLVEARLDGSKLLLEMVGGVLQLLEFLLHLSPLFPLRPQLVLVLVLHPGPLLPLRDQVLFVLLPLSAQLALKCLPLLAQLSLVLQLLLDQVFLLVVEKVLALVDFALELQDFVRVGLLLGAEQFLVLPLHLLRILPLPLTLVPGILQVLLQLADRHLELMLFGLLCLLQLPHALLVLALSLRMLGLQISDLRLLGLELPLVVLALLLHLLSAPGKELLVLAPSEQQGLGVIGAKILHLLL